MDRIFRGSPRCEVGSGTVLPTGMPHEYPKTMADLLKTLAERGVSAEIVRLVMQLGALRTESDKPLIFVLGSAVRGTAGGERLQHLTAWRVDAQRAEEIRACLPRAATQDKF